MGSVQRDSRVDFDRPSTWVRYREGLCEACAAGCCHLPVEVRLEDLQRLGLAEAEEGPKAVGKRLAAQGLVANYRYGTGLFLLKAKSNGACPFLGEDFRCQVYENRPNVCRKFPTEMGPRLGYCPSRRR